jgi:hypothetical protein
MPTPSVAVSLISTTTTITLSIYIYIPHDQEICGGPIVSILDGDLVRVVVLANEIIEGKVAVT